MKADLRLCVAVLLCVASTVAGCASRSARAAANGARVAQPAPAVQLAQADSVPQDPRQAFLQGYKALGRHDFTFAAACFKFAADRDQQIGDYALYYLGLAEKDLGRDAEAEAAMRRVADAYPASVFAERAELVAAEIDLKTVRPGEAAAIASRVVGRTTDPQVEQDARVILARALEASGDPRGAYEQLETLRNKYPRGEADSDARGLERSLLAAHPEIVDVNTLEYRRDEGELLLKEGQASEALAQVDAAMKLSPPPATLAELLWLEARAAHSNPPRAKRVLTEYLTVAPRGPVAPAALDKLARVYWNEDDTARARTFFRRIVRDFPASSFAPDAMLAIGRTFEDDGALSKARDAYDRLCRAYPSSEAASEARFRAAFTRYSMRQYRGAAQRFGAAIERAAGASQRDMLMYWSARALEKSGDIDHARAIFRRLALSIDSNYYPELAGRRVGVQPRDFPAASASDLSNGAPSIDTGDAGFHLARVFALRALDLNELEPAELKSLEGHAHEIPDLRGFVLTGYQDAGAWHGAVAAATRMASRGEISNEAAERFRYPRAYWELIVQAAGRERLDPYLLLSLMRQESLFDPEARSSADARGLMQLLPATAHRIAGARREDSLDLYDPALNIELGSSYLRRLLDMFHGNEFKAVAAYNGGENAVQKWNAKFPGDDDRWVENIGYRETRDYVKKVIGGLREYRLLYRMPSDGSPR